MDLVFSILLSSIVFSLVCVKHLRLQGREASVALLGATTAFLLFNVVMRGDLIVESHKFFHIGAYILFCAPALYLAIRTVVEKSRP